MKLPKADRAFVEREKVVEYLLNPAHRYGSSKARFFGGFGFRAEQWETFNKWSLFPFIVYSYRPHLSIYPIRNDTMTIIEVMILVREFPSILMS